MTASRKAGDVVAGKYVLEREIGQGGLGVVMSAHHAVLRKRVALKFLRREFVRDVEAARRFLREAQAAALMRGEHIARVMDAGALETGEAFLVMEHLEGRDLAAVLEQDGPLSVEDAVDYLLQACEAVAEAHALGIVHRDLKPANLFLTRAPDGSPFVKVLDFGLSKLAAPESPAALTAHHQVLGSPHFMSPEQMRSSHDVDARSDVWALGAVLFTLLAGRYPFEGGTFAEVCAAVLAGTPKRLSDERPDAPEALGAVVARCFRMAPEERYESVASLALALAPFAPQREPPRVERVGRVLEASRTPLPLWQGAPPSPSTSSPKAPSAGPPLSTREALARDSAPAVSTTSGEVPPRPSGQVDRPPWAKLSLSTEIAPPRPSGVSPTLGLKLGSLGVFALALAVWGVLRVTGVGAPAAPVPQRVVTPLAPPAAAALSAPSLPSQPATPLQTDGHRLAQEAISAPPPGPPDAPALRGPARTPSATAPAPPRHAPPGGPPKRPSGPLSDEDLIKSLPH